MSYVDQLRDELVAAAAREQVRTGPRLHLPPLRPLAVATAGVAMAAILVIAIAGGLSTDRAADERPVGKPPTAGRELFPGTLVPGERYRTRGFVPTLSFVVGDDQWYTPDSTSPNVLALLRVTRGGPDEGRFPPRTLAFDRIPAVYDPAVRGIEAARASTPVDLIGWLRRHPDLRVGAAEPVTIAGVRGTRVPIEAAFSRPAHNDPFCRERLRRCTLLWPTASLPDGARVRLIVLATAPEPLVITTSAANARRLAQLERAAAPVLDSLRIGIR
jgi:hypothetical protein